mmetsp:Transcript_5923/g.5081  ORF Transcript_5923/g.5081 Transcript_5923/m.5081 type:complete len:332 (+) Transcript_5923:42-1037(+)
MIAQRWTRRPQLLSQATNMLNGKSYNSNVYPVSCSSGLFIIPQATFCLQWGRNKGADRVRWTNFGSLEQEINSKFNVDHSVPIHPDSRRCGAIGYKMGMTSLFDKWGVEVPCTVLQIDRCQVIQLKENVNGKLKHKIQVGSGEGNIKTIKKPQLGHFLNAGVPIKKHLTEFDVTRENFLPIGYMIGPSHFKTGNFVDLQATTKGKGTQGTIKRWNFKHQFFTHGNSKAHRKPGALQGCEEPGKVFKGKKMAGKMGNTKSTHENSMVIRVDNGRSLLYVKGACPGPIGGMVRIKDAYKKMMKQKRDVNDVLVGVDTYEGAEEDPMEIFELEN